MKVLAGTQQETWHGICAVFYELDAYLAHLARHSTLNQNVPAERLGNESPPRVGRRNGGNS